MAIIFDFRKKFRISNKKCQISRRPENRTFEDDFIKKTKKLKKVDNDHIVCYMNNSNPKDCINIMAGITDLGIKIPYYL